MLRQLARATKLNQLSRVFSSSSPKSGMALTLPMLPVFEAISSHDPQSIAVIHSKSGRRFAYGQLLRDVADASSKLRQAVGGAGLDGKRIAFLVENSYEYVGMCLNSLASTALITVSHSTFHSWKQGHRRPPFIKLSRK